jgi:hypothetical protein
VHKISGDLVKPWITEPKVYTGLSDEAYLADPVVGGSASSSLLKLMLPPSCPAKAKAYLDKLRENEGRQPDTKRYYEIGSAFHTLTLGEGRELAILDAKSWRSNDAQEFLDEQRAAGKIALLAHEAERVRAMRDAVHRHPYAGPLLEPGRFSAETAVVWHDPTAGVMCRAKYDAVPHYPHGGRMTIIDLKSCERADPESVARTILRNGYHISAAHYRNGALALNLAAEVEFVAVFVEKSDPYVVSPVPIDGDWMEWGIQDADDALALYAKCRATGEWPAYEGSDGRVTATPPRWAHYAYENRPALAETWGDPF